MSPRVGLGDYGCGDHLTQPPHCLGAQHFQFIANFIAGKEASRSKSASQSICHGVTSLIKGHVPHNHLVELAYSDLDTL